MKPRFEAIDALLAAARTEATLPPAEQRRALREALDLSRAQVARALGVSPSTVGGWEAGRDPAGDIRERYAYFLEGAHAKLADLDAARQAETAAQASLPDAGLPHAGPATSGGDAAADAGRPGTADQPDPAPEADDVEDLGVPRPCVLCGQPARHQVAGFPQHLDPAACAPQPAPPAADVPTSRPPRPAAPARTVPVARRVRTASDLPDPITEAVAAALARHQGDVDAATAALVKRAIPDAMALLDNCRKGGRYAIVAHPWIPDILRKPSARGADQVWEARPKWTRPELPSGPHEVTALDINGAYLSALKTHLPIGQLEHTAGNHHDRRRAGVHLITPPAWEHSAYLPNPIGNRDEPGPLWVTEPTLRLLLRLAGPKYGLCEPPQIHESFTSGATEGLLEKFRIALKDARERALAEGDEVTLEYVKAMYSKFVSTMGESNYNRELYRPDWMHLIRSQAFANLWMKAHKAHDEGLTVVRAMGTDELHVIGDWRRVFPEGRGVSEVKVKDVYTVGAAPADPAAAQEADHEN
ncbi:MULTISPECIES: helix-turn-helix domain-containing protein [Streptomyces]|uniref:CRO protein n=1 Tax=Streptomyces fradiae ATCC 10745 = DSM 40063 TaxID=1319510 RepID=A0A1Y2NUK7_STRFR|nr:MULTISPECIES: helix-turn-helix transcriptional regulator [Streptomyces]KAF0646838.1 CRO protein [Streptomyces fradiae ATCC 10745 = DSM 40063]OSY49633.1 helix-turn-helix protein [Streptomyces fradiae ATCC 10745 = DSM 40063]OSY51118.1 helix-turn-helix protein [Streptomyces fradiae ATCC 10745 = DSM 40063]OSY51176.1 helix-turn-helix protein [Streptomyces fradiae ATCC 10745 = DSM 40063]QEV10696.1 XRE family transcriptional regulator [Streptomyces fradiae ATCC 10745 = DSM 40063]